MWEAAKSMHGTLLIVPYGIETTVTFSSPESAPSLLIVPYGIETYYHDTPVLVLGLLIVPYGIETHLTVGATLENSLLIVPYGIETRNFLLRRFHLCIF